MGCCNAKQKAPDSKHKRPEQVKKDKYGRPMHRARGDPFIQQEMVYSNMEAMAELAARDPARFIKLTQVAEVKDFSKYVGFDMVPHKDIILKSCRQILTTADWNPLTFALVVHDENPILRDYILEQCNFNVPQMLAIGLPKASESNYRELSEEGLIEGQIKTLMILAENHSQNFELILNRFSHFLPDKLIAKLITSVAQAGDTEVLRTMMQTHAVRGLFFDKVENSGTLLLKGGFQAFFQEFLAGATRSGKKCGEVLFHCLQEDPYQVVFGIYLLKTEEAELCRQFGPVVNRKSIQAAFKTCGTFTAQKSFQIYRVFGTKISPVELDDLTEMVTKDSPTGHHAELKEASDFVANLQKKESFARSLQQDTIKSLHKGVLKGSVSDVRSVLRQIPKEALFLIDGLEIPSFIVNPFPSQTDQVEVDTSDMNMLEIACCLGHTKLLDFLLKDCCVRNNRDFVPDRHTKSISEQKFIFIPLLKRDERTVATLLEMTNLWSLQDLKDMMLLCKQLKWAEGIETILRSKSCHRQYLTIPHTSQNMFLHYVSKIPYQLIDDIEADDESTELELSRKGALRITVKGVKIIDQQVLNPQEKKDKRPASNVGTTRGGGKSMISNGGDPNQRMEFDDHERYEMRRCISLSLSQRPYASSFMILDFVPKPGEDDSVKTMQVPSQLLYDKIDTAISCNENASDWELHDFIVASSGSIVERLRQGIHEKSQNVSEHGREEFEMYTQEISFFLERLSNHPSLEKCLGENKPAQPIIVENKN